jgi:hypothetical protein
VSNLRKQKSRESSEAIPWYIISLKKVVKQGTMNDAPSSLLTLKEENKISPHQFEYLTAIFNERLDENSTFVFQDNSEFFQDRVMSEMLQMEDFYHTQFATFTDEEVSEARSLSRDTLMSPILHNQQWFKKVHFVRSMRHEIICRLNVFVDYSHTKIDKKVELLSQLSDVNQCVLGVILPLTTLDNWLLCTVIEKVRTRGPGCTLSLPTCCTLMFSNDADKGKLKKESHAGLIIFTCEENGEVTGSFIDTSFSAQSRELYEQSELLVGSNSVVTSQPVGTGSVDNKRVVPRVDYIRVRLVKYLIQECSKRNASVHHNLQMEIQPWRFECCSLAHLLYLLLQLHTVNEASLMEVIQCFTTHPSFRKQKPPRDAPLDNRSAHLTLLLLFEKWITTHYAAIFTEATTYCEVAATDMEDKIGYTVCTVCDQSDHEPLEDDSVVIEESNTTNLLMVCDYCGLPNQCNYAQHNGTCGAGYVGLLATDDWYCPTHSTSH